MKFIFIIALLAGGELLQADALRTMMNRSIKHYNANMKSVMAEFDSSRASLVRMAITELDIPSVQQLERFGVNIVPIGTVSAMELVWLIVHEYGMRVSALTKEVDSRSSKKEVESFIMQSLANRALILKFSDASKQVVDSKVLLAQYSELTATDVSRNLHSINVNTIWERWSLALSWDKYATDTTVDKMLKRFRTRAKLASGNFTSVLDALSGMQLNQAQLARLQQADLDVGWNIYASAIIPKLGRMVSPGVVIQAKIYEFAARVAALMEEDSLVELCLSLILRLQENPDDHVVMTISTSEDNYLQRLDKNSLEEIAALYRQKIN